MPHPFHRLMRLPGLMLLGALGLVLRPQQGRGQAPGPSLKPRIVITTDPELDDNNSMIRFLLYSCDVKVEGLIYASSGYHWKGDGKGTRWYVPGREYSRFGQDTCPCSSWRWPAAELYIDRIVEAYAKVYPNLALHHSGYPTPAYLKSRIRVGNVAFDGDISQDSPGSSLIKSLILDDQPGKLYITAWGGMSTIARALRSIQEQYRYTAGWPELKSKISRKVVLLPSGDQDDTYAEYIGPNWPGIECRHFSEGPNYGYGAQLGARPEDSAYLSASWMKAHVSDQGPLGALYRVWGDGKQMVKGDKMDFFGFSGYSARQLRNMGYVVWMPVQSKGSWLGEGDDPTFMNMLNNGLRAYQKASYGGWGGVQRPGQPSRGLSALPSDTSRQALARALASMNRRRAGQKDAYPDFFPAAQRDFAARLSWSVSPRYQDANHPPAVRVEGPLELMVSAGETLKLHGEASDPDGNAVQLRWWQFHVGSYPGSVGLEHADSSQVTVRIPRDVRSGQTIQLILEGTDSGSPALTRYQRVVCRVR